MVNELIKQAVREASKEYKDIPDFEERCIEHAEKLEEFAEELKKRGCKEVKIHDIREE